MLWHYLQVYWAPCQNQLSEEIRHKRQISEWIDSSEFRQFNTKGSKQKHVTHHNIFAEFNLLDIMTLYIIHLQILESRYIYIHQCPLYFLVWKTQNLKLCNHQLLDVLLTSEYTHRFFLSLNFRNGYFEIALICHDLVRLWRVGSLYHKRKVFRRPGF